MPRKRGTTRTAKPGLPKQPAAPTQPSGSSPDRGADSAKPEVQVVWRRLVGTERDVQLAALGVIETLTQHLQRTTETTPLLSPRRTTHPGAPEPPTLQQAAEPVGFTIDRNEIVRWTWENPHDSSIRLHLADGSELVLDGKERARGKRRSTVGGVELEPKRRRPSRVMRRPGQGGVIRTYRDPFEQLDRYGSCNYLNCLDSARVCQVNVSTLDEAIAALVGRNSAEEKEQRLRLQVEPCWAMAEAFSLPVRLILAATHMSGLRHVREPNTLPPPPNTPERDDMLILFRAIERGLINTVVVRDIDRLARDELEGFRIINFFKSYDVRLFVDELGREIDYVRDHKTIREAFSLGRDERDKTVTRTQRGLLTKGPLSGKGWLAPTPFGFLRDPETKDLYEDEEQWWLILLIFELADEGAPDGSAAGMSGPMSTREISSYLEREFGIDIGHEKIRAILRNPIYATGERTCRVRGIEIAQDPVVLKNPVPLDRFERVQAHLGLRKGRSTRTAIGEYILNTVEVVHLQCGGITAKDGHAILIKGHNIASHGGERTWGNYRHSPAVPACCKGAGRGCRGAFTWTKEELEHPIIASVLEIAEHPEVLRQAALAARHDFATTTGQLSDEQRLRLEGEHARAVEELDALADSYVAECASAGREVDMHVFAALREAQQKRVDRLQRRLNADDYYRGAVADGASVPGNKSVEQRLNAFREILTKDTPAEPEMRKRRARLFQRIVSRVEIDDDGTGPITVYLYGHLVPDHAHEYEINPITASHDLLDAHIAGKNGQIAPADIRVAQIERERSQIETALSERPLKAVSNWQSTQALLALPSAEKQSRARTQSLESRAWHRTRGGIYKSMREHRVPAWRRAIPVPAQ